MAQGAHDVQLLPGTPAGQPGGSLSPDLKNHVQFAVSGPADGDRAAQQQPLPAFDIDKLAHLGLVGHGPGLEPQGDGVSVQAFHRQDLTYCLDGHRGSLPFLFIEW